MNAVILAGGLGTRLRPYTLFLPKPMLPLGDKPVLEHIIDWLKDYDISDFVISVGYLRRIVEDYFRDGDELGVRIKYAKSDKPLGTAGQLKQAENYLDERYICIYGDSIYDFNLKSAISFHKKRGAIATIVLMNYKTHLKYGFIDLNKNGSVSEWREKPEVSGLINVGCYVMEKEFLKYIPKRKMFGMNTAFRNALQAGELICGFPTKGTITDIGDKKSYTTAHEAYLNKIGKIL